MQISGHMFDVPELRAREEGFFLPITTSWGWATWKRAWISSILLPKDGNG